MASGYDNCNHQIKNKRHDNLAEHLICLNYLSLVKLQVRRYLLRPLLPLFFFLSFFGLLGGLDRCIGFGF